MEYLPILQVMIIIVLALGWGIAGIRLGDKEAIRLNQEDRIRALENMLIQEIDARKETERGDLLRLIERFNVMYGLPMPSGPTIFPGEALFSRLSKFKRTLLAELMEVDQIISAFGNERRGIGLDEMAEHLANVADWLCDIQIYCASEMRKFGLPQPEIMRIIMESNFSKLGADGKAILDSDGKVQKGPGYWRPEPKILALIKTALHEQYKGRRP